MHDFDGQPESHVDLYGNYCPRREPRSGRTKQEKPLTVGETEQHHLNTSLKNINCASGTRLNVRIAPISESGMVREIDDYFLQKNEPVRSCLAFLRNHILTFGPDISEAWRYRMPFYLWQGKRFCYLWENKKMNMPYLGIVNGHRIVDKKLMQGDRSRMKIMLMDPANGYSRSRRRQNLKESNRSITEWVNQNWPGQRELP